MPSSQAQTKVRKISGVIPAAAPAGQRGGRQLHHGERPAVDVPHRGAVAGPARMLRQVDHRLPAFQPVEPQRCGRAPVRRPAGGADHHRGGQGPRHGPHGRLAEYKVSNFLCPPLLDNGGL